MTKSQRIPFESGQKNFKVIFEASFPANAVELSKSPLYLAIQRRLKQVGRDLNISVEEVVSELWIRAERQFEKGNSIASPDGWMYTTAHRIIADMMREKLKNRDKQVWGELDETLIPSLQFEQLSSIEQIEADQERTKAWAKVQQAMQNLTHKDRELLMFTIVHGGTCAEFAKVNNSKPATVRQQKKRALAELGKIFSSLA
jgi:RNA polymerase sigma factor (sigma-70 family)